MTVRGVATFRIWDVDELEAFDPDWGSRSKKERLELLSNPSEYPVSPIDERVEENMVVDGYLEAFAAGDNPQPSHLALGDGTTAPSGSNTSLNNEVYRTIVGQDTASNRDRLTSTLISQNEANGLAIREIGFVTGTTSESWILLTHNVLDSANQIDEKTSNMSVTIDYVLEFRRVS